MQYFDAGIGICRGDAVEPGLIIFNRKISRGIVFYVTSVVIMPYGLDPALYNFLVGFSILSTDRPIGQRQDRNLKMYPFDNKNILSR